MSDSVRPHRQMAAHQAPSSLGFSRQEHWSGLPFPSPMHASEGESEVAQLCPTLSDPMDFIACQSPPSMGFSRQEHWSGLPFPFPMRESDVQLLATPWTAAYQAPPSIGFSRQEYWSGVPLPSPLSYTVILNLHLHYCLYGCIGFL